MGVISVKDKKFNLYIPHNEIINRIVDISSKINVDYKGKDPLFLCVLNGSFMFAAELYQRIDIPSNISFVKISSYSGMESTQNIKQLIGFDIPVKDRDIIIIEDIVDTGLSMKYILSQLDNMGVKSVSIATLLFKPDAFKENFSIDYVGFDIPNKFIVGFGLDYDGYGRNYDSIYQLVQPKD